jgi:NAD-dependent deacetylase
MKKKIVVLTGAGISAESGLATFRDSGGLWEGYKIEDVATPEAWHKNKELVLEFYNLRRKAAQNAKPNSGHKALVALETLFDVTIITQNVDNLHEQARSSAVIHLHGELFKSRSTADEHLIYDIKGWELKPGDLCEKGSQLRPHIVWFGEAVPLMDRAIREVRKAELFVVVGTSLQVYPAAGLLDYVPEASPKYIIDPAIPMVVEGISNLITIQEKATVGLDKLLKELKTKF